MVEQKTSENVGHKIPTKNEVGEILSIVKMAYLDHQMIPTDLGVYLDKEKIRNKHLKIMINFCLEKGLFDSLGYLYYEWFAREQFFLWARSSKEDIVCRYRTSMFAESHFRYFLAL
jgi:hypothetical protein